MGHMGHWWEGGGTDGCWQAAEQERHHWLFRGVLASFYALGRWLVIDCMGHTDGLDGKDRLDGTLVGRGWNGRTLAGSGTGAPPSAPEQERYHWLLRGGGWWVAVSVANCFGVVRGAEYLCQSSKIIQKECRQIGTST